MKSVQVKSKDWLKEALNVITNQEPYLGHVVVDTGIVIVPRKGVVDEQLCYELGYQVYEVFTRGGVIVANDGDIDIAHFDKTENNWLKDFIDYFIHWLKEKGLNAEFNDNDILIDGHKICGSFITRHTELIYSGIHIGINTNLEDIKRICTKPMKKIPKGLSEYGITTEEVEQMFLEFCERGVDECLHT